MRENIYEKTIENRMAEIGVADIYSRSIINHRIEDALKEVAMAALYFKIVDHLLVADEEEDPKAVLLNQNLIAQKIIEEGSPEEIYGAETGHPSKLLVRYLARDIGIEDPDAVIEDYSKEIAQFILDGLCVEKYIEKN